MCTEPSESRAVDGSAVAYTSPSSRRTRASLSSTASKIRPDVSHRRRHSNHDKLMFRNEVVVLSRDTARVNDRIIRVLMLRLVEYSLTSCRYELTSLCT